MPDQVQQNAGQLQQIIHKGMISNLIRVTNYDRKRLEELGLLQPKRTGFFPQDANFAVVNKQHKSRDKSTYVAETRAIMTVLGHMEGLNLQPISAKQLQSLNLSEEQIQTWGTYKPKALVYEDEFKRFWMEKRSDLMISLGIWRENKSRRSVSVQNQLDY